jgi:hypothetical protein
VKARSNTGGVSAIITRLAFDIFGVPAMTSEPERVFSVAGHVIGAALCLKSWDEMGAIKWQ